MSDCLKNLIDRFVKIAIFLAVGSIISLLSYWLNSSFLSQFYGVALISAILACTALSFAMYSFIANRLIEIKNRFPQNFQRTNRELYIGLTTQIGLLAALFILLILYHSPIAKNCWNLSILFLETLINTIILCFIYIMYDMGRTIHIIIDCFDVIMTLKKENTSKKDS